MKAIYISVVALMTFNLSAQTEEVVTEEIQEEVSVESTPPDTTRIKIGKKEVIIIGEDEANDDFEDEFEPNDDKPKKDRFEAHWAGIDFGFNVLMNQNFGTDFKENPYWQNDAAKSQTWNLNLLEYKFKLAREYVGLTTGIGFNFNSYALKNDYVLIQTADTIYAEIDTVFNYTKNKLKSTYLTVPLLVEFNTNADASKSFYFAAGVVGGVRIASKVKRKGDFDGKSFVQKEKGTFGMNAFKLDLTTRLGYGDWGCFASYNVLPLFEKDKTVEVYPLTFGLSLNFN